VLESPQHSDIRSLIGGTSIIRSSTITKNQSPPAVIFNFIAGRWVSHLIYVAAKLELADHLKDGSAP
jgi:hypothetical protein